MERSFQSPSVPTASRFKRQGVRGRVEPLERRWMLSVISVYATDAYATEGESTGTLVFSRDGSLTQSLTLNYAVSGSATPGVDFQSIGGAITIPAGLASTSLAIVPIADNIAEPTEFVTVTLGAAAGYAIDLGSATDSTITLTLGPGTYFVSVAASLDLSMGDYWLDLFL